MTFLTDDQILKKLKEKEQIIFPFEESAVTSNGYDLLMEDFILEPGEFKLIKSLEKVKIPSDVISLAFLRTTYAFKGLVLSSGVIDAGYEGYLKFAIHNISKEVIKTEKNDELKRPIQLVFIKSEKPVSKAFGKRGSEKNNLI